MHELAALPGDPVPPMLERIEASLERFRIHFDTWARESEVEADIPEAIALLDTYERTGRSGRGRPRTATTRTACSSARTARRPTSPPTPPTSAASSRAASTGSSTSSAPTTTATSRASRRSPRCSGTHATSLEVLIYQLVHLVEGGEAKKMSKRRGDVVFLDELIDAIGVDAARWYLVSRGHDQTIELDVDLAEEKTQKNPVYYVQYAHARIAGILRNAGGDAVEPRRCRPRPLEPEERELVKRLLEFPAVVAEATERRAPHAIPTYAIRVADDFHRFYHQHRVLELGAARRSGSGSCVAVQVVIARCLDLIGVDAPERM